MAQGVSTFTASDQNWGCNQCDCRGHAKNAMALAANHTKHTGHETWANNVISVRYVKKA